MPRKDGTTERTRPERRVTPALLALLCLVGLGPPALAQTGAPGPSSVSDYESEPDLPGLLAAVKAISLTEPLPGLRVGSAEYAKYGIRIHVFDFAQERFQVRIAEQKQATGSRAGEFLGAKSDVFVINGGFFERDDAERLSPSGLLIVDGATIADQHQRAGSGVLYVDEAGVEITSRKNFKERSQIRQAVQVGPLLVDPGGVNGIYKNDLERHNRGAVCRRGGAFTAFVVEGGISLFQFAELLSRPPAEGGFGCDIAINLDGGPSTQAALRAGKTRLDIAGRSTVQNVIVVSKR